MLGFMWLGLGQMQAGSPLGADARGECPQRRGNCPLVTARPPLRVLGIDPGTASTGFGVVESGAQAPQHRLRRRDLDGGRTFRSSAAWPRSPATCRELLDEHEPDALAIEEVFFGRNVRSAFAVGQARGAVLAAAGAREVPCFSYTPQAVKLAVCGSGAARQGPGAADGGRAAGAGGAAGLGPRRRRARARDLPRVHRPATAD